MKGTDIFGMEWSKTKTATISGYFSAGEILYKENADMVVILLKDLVLNEDTTSIGSVVFATGLPKPNQSYIFILTDFRGNNFLRCSYKTDGKIYLHYPNAVAPSSLQFYGQVIAFKR